MKYFVYILECADNTYYVGYTIDLQRRILEHNSEKSLTRYTRGRRPVALKYFEEFDNKGDALRREMEIKGMGRGEKGELINN